MFLSLVFAAVGNPTGDVITMFLFAIPQLFLMLIAYVICLLQRPPSSAPRAGRRLR